jgi:hypothetical protein
MFLKPLLTSLTLFLFSLTIYSQDSVKHNLIDFGARFYDVRPCGGCPEHKKDTAMKNKSPYEFAEKTVIEIDSTNIWLLNDSTSFIKPEEQPIFP